MQLNQRRWGYALIFLDVKGIVEEPHSVKQCCHKRVKEAFSVTNEQT